MSAYTPTGLYLSVPFCKAKCSFCNFASDAFAPGRMDGYVERLCEEIRGARANAARMGAEARDEIVEYGRLGPHIGINDRDVAPTGSAQAEIAGHGGAAISVEFNHCEQSVPFAAQLPQNLAAPVGRTVVHNDQFIVLAGVSVLSEDGWNADRQMGR